MDKSHLLVTVEFSLLWHLFAVSLSSCDVPGAGGRLQLCRASGTVLPGGFQHVGRSQ